MHVITWALYILALDILEDFGDLERFEALLGSFKRLGCVLRYFKPLFGSLRRFPGA